MFSILCRKNAIEKEQTRRVAKKEESNDGTSEKLWKSYLVTSVFKSI